MFVLLHQKIQFQSPFVAATRMMDVTEESKQSVDEVENFDDDKEQITSEEANDAPETLPDGNGDGVGHDDSDDDSRYFLKSFYLCLP